MTAPPGTEVTPAELRVLDAQYRPFPDFQAFSAAVELDTDLWERVAAGLQQKQADVDPGDFDRAVEVALRAAAVDTGAIEGLYKVDRGFTVTVAEEQPGWEAEADKKGAAFRQLFASQLRGYELARELAAGDTPTNEAWIRELHSEITAGQQTYRVWIPSLRKYQQQALLRGQYKTQSNHVKQADGDWHAYAPVDEVPAEMQRLLEQIRTPEFDAAHPSLQAAYAHYAFVVIHPFADGNGRVARAIASAFLIKSCGVPLVIWSDQDDEYLDALSAADHGNYQVFVDLTFHYAFQAIQLVADRIGSSLEEQAETLRETLVTPSGISQEELSSVGNDLLSYLQRRIESIVDDVGPLAGVDVQLRRGHGYLPVDIEGYDEVDSNYLHLEIDLTSAMPVRTQTSGLLRVLGNTEAPVYPLLIQDFNARAEFPVRLADVLPEMSDSFKYRIDSWVRRFVADSLKRLTRDAEQSLREAGY